MAPKQKKEKSGLTKKELELAVLNFAAVTHEVRAALSEIRASSGGAPAAGGPTYGFFLQDTVQGTKPKISDSEKSPSARPPRSMGGGSEFRRPKSPVPPSGRRVPSGLQNAMHFEVATWTLRTARHRSRHSVAQASPNYRRTPGTLRGSWSKRSCRPHTRPK